MHPQRLTAVVAVIVSLGWAGSRTCAQESGVQWLQDLNAAQQQAASNRKLVLVHFWAPWCLPCKRLDQEVFNQPHVAQAIHAAFVPVKLNADHFPASARQYGVASLPTDVVLTSTGELVTRMNSPLTAQAYISQVTQVAMLNQGPARHGLAGLAAQQHAPSHQALSNGAPSPVQNPFLPQSSANAPSTPEPSSTASNASVPPPANHPYTNLAHRPGAANAWQHPADFNTGGNRSGAAGEGPQGAWQTTPQTTPSVPRYAPTASPWPPSAAGGVGPTGAPNYASPASQTPHDHAGSRYQISPAWPPNTAPPTTPPATPPTATPTGAPGFRPAIAPQGSTSTPDPASNPSLGLDGFCPVTLKNEKKWVRGSREWGAVHRGRTYLFSGADEQRAFLANPDLYSPVLSGADPVLAMEQQQLVSGKRNHGVFYDGFVYLFSSETSLDRFSKNPEKYAARVRQAMQLQPATLRR